MIVVIKYSYSGITNIKKAYANGGSYVSELEFVKGLISLLNESDKRGIIKQAVAKGFEVHGFSKTPYNAPKNIINSSLTRRNKKNISNYFLILDVINRFPLEQAEDKTLIEFAKSWINSKDDKERDIIEKEMMFYCHGTQDNQLADSENSDNVDSAYTDGVNSESGTQTELEEKNILLQKKNKELKEKLKSSKIELDNLRKDFNICMKEEKKQLSEIKRLQQLSEEYSINQSKLEEKLKESRNYSADLLSQVEMLSHYKDKALKIACFVQENQSLKLDGYNITFFDKWNEHIKENTDFNSYSEVWYVHEGFNYNCFLEVKKYFKCNTKEYMTVKKLMNEV